MDFAATFAGRRILVTGHTGFKGSWLVLWLKRLGAVVHGYALDPPTHPSLFAECSLRGIMDRDWHGAITDGDKLAAAFQKAQPEIVFHLAAQAILRKSYRNPAATWWSNVTGTVNVLEACRTTPSVKVCVVATSDKCYDSFAKKSFPKPAFLEGDRLGGHDPYSASKAAVEIAVDSWRRSYWPQAAVSVSTVRAGNVIGGGDWGEHRMVPNAIRALEDGQPVPVYTDYGVRPWQHVLDCLAGYLSLAAMQMAHPQRCAEPFNIGAPVDMALTAEALARRIVRRWGSGTVERVTLPTAAQEIETDILRLDVRKAQDLLGWSPRLSPAEMIEWTVDWYKRRHEQGEAFDARAACDGQIEEWMRR